MKRLYNSLLESLLDDEEDLMDNMDEIIYKQMINDPDSDFRIDFQCYNGNERVKPDLSQSFYKDHILGINAMHINQNTNIPLKQYFPNVKELYCGAYLNKARESVISDKTVAEKLVCCQVNCHHTLGMNNIDIEINPKYLSKELKVGFLTSLNNFVKLVGYGSCELNNVSINWDNSTNTNHRAIIFSHFHGIPKFKNVSGNAKRISIYDNMFFENNDVDKIFSIFEWPHKVMIRDHKKAGEDIEMTIKGLKKAKSIANNQNRYTLITQLFKLKKNAKLSDIIDIKKLPELETVVFRSNNVELVFTKKPEKNMYIAEPEPLKPQTFQTTADGWTVYLEKSF